MSSQEMYQLFQVLYDQIDSQIYPEIYPEQVFSFLNLELDRWCKDARKTFDSSTELKDYMLPLVVDVYTSNLEIEPGTEANYSLKALKQAETGEVVPYRYMVATKFADCTITKTGQKGSCYLKEQTHNHRSATAQNPLEKPKPYLCYYVLKKDTVVVDTNPSFYLGTARFTIIKKPAVISKTQDCDLPDGLHALLVEMAVLSAKNKLQPVQQ